jgi:hypothetical protein
MFVQRTSLGAKIAHQQHLLLEEFSNSSLCSTQEKLFIQRDL